MRFFAIAFLAVSIVAHPHLAASEMEIPVIPAQGVKTYRKVASWRDLNASGIVKQQYDYSCGSGSLATLLNMQYGEKVTEAQIIEMLLKDKSKEEIRVIEESGYSLLDLKKVAEAKGYSVTMLKLRLEDLYKLTGPVLIYFEPDGEKHFAVLKRVRGEKAYLADPAQGNIRISLYRFKEEWHGVIFAIGK
jgi:predicted double-glycine peptidase